MAPVSSPLIQGADMKPVAPQITDDDNMLPHLVDIHPHRENWPPWMGPSLARLEAFSDHAEWRNVLNTWLEFEHQLGYLYGQVSLTAFCRSVIYSYLMAQRRRLCSSIRACALTRSISG
jgi:hypothetical protein